MSREQVKKLWLLRPGGRVIICAIIAAGLSGCSKPTAPTLTSSVVKFDPGGNNALTARISEDGKYDKMLIIEGSVRSEFCVIVEVTMELCGQRASSAAEVWFTAINGELAPVNSWKISGGGERPALRRESDKEVVIYYPQRLPNGMRSWGRFRIVLADRQEVH